MPTMGYVRIEGEEQGHIEGPAEYEGEDGLIGIFSFDHEVAIPRKATEAVTAGRPVHQEIVIGKLVDRATPRLYQAMDQHERLTRVEFSWYEYNSSGIRELAFSIELENALVTRIRPTMPDFMDPDSDRYRFLEHVALSYETITWSWGQGDIQFEASWHGDEE